MSPTLFLRHEPNPGLMKVLRRTLGRVVQSKRTSLPGDVELADGTVLTVAMVESWPEDRLGPARTAL